MKRLTILLLLAVFGIAVLIFSIGAGAAQFTPTEVLRALVHADDSTARLIVWHVRLPRVLTSGLVGVCLALSGCILQGVMRNNLASPSTIGVTGGASFIGYLTLVAFPAYFYLLPLGSIVGAFLTTMLIYLLAYSDGVNPVKMILSGLAVSALFGAFNDIIKVFFAERIANVQGFLVGGFVGITWESLHLILPYALVGTVICFFLPTQMNILMLGDENANSLGLRTERFRFFLIAISSLLAGASVAVAGLISFVGLIVPHIARLLVGSDHHYLFPAAILLGASLVTICDTIGRIVILPAEMPVSVILSFIGAPFFLYLLRKRKR